jgi:hypothetical protein
VPREIKSKDAFLKLLDTAIELRMRKSDGGAKLKLRTPGILYTFKTSSEEADSLTKGTKVEVVEY